MEKLGEKVRKMTKVVELMLLSLHTGPASAFEEEEIGTTT